MRRVIPILAAALLAMPGCGSDESKIERGLAPADEVTTPESEAQLDMTAEQRDEERERELEKAQDQAFDREAGGADD